MLCAIHVCTCLIKHELRDKGSFLKKNSLGTILKVSLAWNKMFHLFLVGCIRMWMCVYIKYIKNAVMLTVSKIHFRWKIRTSKKDSPKYSCLFLFACLVFFFFLWRVNWTWRKYSFRLDRSKTVFSGKWDSYLKHFNQTELWWLSSSKKATQTSTGKLILMPFENKLK